MGYFTGKGQGYNYKYLTTIDPSAIVGKDGVVSAYGSEIEDLNAALNADSVSSIVGDLSSKLGLSNNIILDDEIGEEVFLMNQLSATYTLGTSFEGGVGDGARGVYTNTGIGRTNYPNTIVMDETQLRGAQLEGNVGPTGNNIIGKAFNNTLIEASPEIQEQNTSNILSISPDYQKKNIALRTNFGDPGSNGPKIRSTAEPSGRLNYGVKASDMIAVDKINAMNMYSGSIASTDERPVNDLCKFRIAAIDNDNPGSALYMHFRAFINSFTDNYSSQWNGFKYVRRGEELYHYTGFDRSINLSFDVYAQSKAELIPMYRKLNYLASTMAPDYTSAGVYAGKFSTFNHGRIFI